MHALTMTSQFNGQFGPCPLLTAVHRRSPFNRARSGHGSGLAADSADHPLTRSFRARWLTAAFPVRAGFPAVWLPLDV
jgi:hypothetical protein